MVCEGTVYLEGCGLLEGVWFEGVGLPGEKGRLRDCVIRGDKKEREKRVSIWNKNLDPLMLM